MKGYFRKRGEKWSFSIDLPRDPVTNQRKQKTVSGFKTKKEAEKACAALITQIEQEEYVEPTKQTVAEFFKSWLAGKELSVKKVTYNTYSRHITLHIIPGLGHIELKKLSRDHILAFYKHLVQEKKLGDRTIFDIHGVLKRAIANAVEWQLVSRNVMKIVDTPKVAKKKIQVWTFEECAKFREVSISDPLHIAFILGLTTGMRQSEVLGLSWQDVNLESMEISVRQTLDHEGTELQDGTKSDAGERLITLDEETVNELKRQHKRIKADKFRLGASYEDNNLVVATKFGTPIRPRNLLRTMYRLMDAAKVKKIAFHDLRHTHATLLLAQGVNPKIVSERLGHSNVKITLDTYSHVLPNMQKNTAAEFGRVFYQKEVAADKQGGQNVVN
ncbi:site-specific integrase [Paenibacillus kobensis]|uniref:site-specific integrase n=1 Tax=Paenibacillus kobensis TaxID=59841 RepID=UPI000FD972F8|nr:site-specific integrase [Paenibacillus kobensis]